MENNQYANTRDNIIDLFNEHQESFTVYVVEQRFANYRGREYFNSFKGKPNFISTEEDINSFLGKILSWIGKNMPQLKSIIEKLLLNQKKAALDEIILIMSQTFNTYNHQAVGPEVIDPIIIQEGKISQKKLTQLIHLHQYSLLQPSIIIILMDDELERAQQLLKFCPNGTNVKLIRNDGQSTMFKIINSGLDDLETFLDMFSMQCFSACSHTKKDVLLSDELLSESMISYYSPLMFQIRSKLLNEDKQSCMSDLEEIIRGLSEFKADTSKEEFLKKGFLCLAKLNRVFCRDRGGQDILDALSIANELNNEILRAHVYRYAYFLPGLKETDQKELLADAKTVFRKNRLADHAIYCENNELVLQFHTDKIDPHTFNALAVKAVNDVHGLVGISHIYNNAGAAYLLSGNPARAMDYFKKGYSFADCEDRALQRVAIEVNMLLTRSYSLEHIDDREIILCMREIFDSMNGEVPYLYACYTLNLLAVAHRQSSHLYKELITMFKAEQLIQEGLRTNIMGSGPLIMQLKTLYSRSSDFDIITRVPILSDVSYVSGKRASFIKRYGFNPAIFYVWI